MDVPRADAHLAPARSGRKRGLLHTTAEVVETGAAKALVRLGCELWTARYRGDVHAGDRVVVDGRHGRAFSIVAAAPPATGPAEPVATDADPPHARTMHRKTLRGGRV